MEGQCLLLPWSHFLIIIDYEEMRPGKEQAEEGLHEKFS
jgi:hypothetical protein